MIMTNIADACSTMKVMGQQAQLGLSRYLRQESVQVLFKHLKRKTNCKFYTIAYHMGSNGLLTL